MEEEEGRRRRGGGGGKEEEGKRRGEGGGGKERRGVVGTAFLPLSGEHRCCSVVKGLKAAKGRREAPRKESNK